MRCARGCTSADGRGWVEGRNIKINAYWATGQQDMDAVAHTLAAFHFENLVMPGGRVRHEAAARRPPGGGRANFCGILLSSRWRNSTGASWRRLLRGAGAGGVLRLFLSWERGTPSRAMRCRFARVRPTPETPRQGYPRDKQKEVVSAPGPSV